MALDIEEHQQVEQLKQTVKEYGPSVLIGIGLAAVLLFGYQHYSKIRERAYDHASIRYEQLLDALAANKTQAANVAANYLIKRYPKSDYAKLAELLLAQRDITESQFSSANMRLKDVMEHGHTPAIKEIARLRLARLQIQQNDAKAALSTLSAVDAKEYLPLVSSVRGDAYAKLHQANDARQAYQQALTGIPEGAMLHSLVALKLNNLPT